MPEVHKKISGFDPFESFNRLNEPSKGQSLLDRVLYYEFKTFLNGLLLVEDKLSMAHGVETRVPYLDNDIVDLVERIPSTFKYKPPYNYKIILKKAIEDLLPKEIINLRKQGFTPPAYTWYKTTLRPFIQDTLLGKKARSRGVFNIKQVKEILNQHDQGKRNHRLLIWSLLFIEHWFRLFFDRESL